MQAALHRLLARWHVSEASSPALGTLIGSPSDLSLERLAGE